MKNVSALLLCCSVVACTNAPRLAPYAPPPSVVGPHAPNFSATPNVAIVATQGGTAETSIAVSPADPNRVVVAGSGPTTTRQRRSEAYVSTDGGATWSAKMPMPDTIGKYRFEGGGDPVVTVDRQGRFYFTSLVNGIDPPTTNGLVVSRSDDGGLTWNEPVIVSLNIGVKRPYDDKQWIVADDTGGPHDGNVYLQWGHYAEAFTAEPGEIWFSRSTDHGLTWSTPLALTPSTAVGLSELEIGPQGEVYATYYQRGRGFVLRTSLDGGMTFDEPKPIPSNIGPPGGKLPNVAALYRPMQSFAVDRSNGPARGTLYYLMPGRQPRPGTSESAGAIALLLSRDGGRTWTAPHYISGDTRGADAVLPSIAVDQTSGEVLAAWVDRRDDPANTVARLYASRSTDGGTTWSTPAAVSAPFTIDASFIGDYNGAAAHAGRWVAAFSDDGGYMSVARINLGQTVPATAPAGPRRRSIRP